MSTRPCAASRDAAGWLVAGLLLSAAGVAVAVSPGESDAYSRAFALTRASGYGALVCMCCALCVTPLSRLTRRVQSSRGAAGGLRRPSGAHHPEASRGGAARSTQPASAAEVPEVPAVVATVRVEPFHAPRLRRALGIGSACCAIVHALQAWLGVPGVSSTLLSAARLRAGLAALVILALLLLTSFPRLVARLGLQYWKELHRLAYAALAFAFLHALLGAFAPLSTLLALASATFGSGLLRLLPDRRAAPEDEVGPLP